MRARTQTAVIEIRAIPQIFGLGVLVALQAGAYWTTAARGACLLGDVHR